MKKIMTFALSLLFFTACNAQTKTGSKSQSQPQQTMEQIALSDSTVIVDVRTPGEYAEGHIEKSINIPVDEISRESAQQQLKGYKTIITVCRSGG
ncbi:MAG: rhodanese-like domain-containing protein, partial [Tannerella sp.]|nr:rhodanese-like domain-containing protein [Tannerella sp.]